MTKNRRELNLLAEAGVILQWMAGGGVLCTVVDREGAQNLLTLGWGQMGL